MASDVTEDEGRYRGLDMDEEEYDTPTMATNDENTATQTLSLQETIQKQAEIITRLEKQLAQYETDNAVNGNDQKKRKIDPFDMVMIEDTADKDIRIEELTKQVTLLTEELAAERRKQEDKSAEVKKSSLLQTPNIKLQTPNYAMLIQEVKQAIGPLIEETLERKLEEKLGTVSPGVEAGRPQSSKRNYAAALQGSKNDRVNDFRDIVAAAKNEEKAEERERNLRQNNIIMHGCVEANNDQEAQDKVFINKFINDLTISKIETKSVVRIGQKTEGKKRPIKITLSNVSDKNKIMENLRNLKDKGYNGISITEDYTFAEREMIKDFREKAKSANEQLAPDSEMTWVVRGNPKNGLFTKKVKKFKEVTQTQ